MTASGRTAPGVTASGRTAGGGTDRGPLFVTEVFSAIQGEGALVGRRQVFVRLAGCNIRCAYCDQPEALEKLPGPCRIEKTAGRRDWEVAGSPLPTGQVAQAVERLFRSVPHDSVSLTGGEPLFQAGRLGALLAAFSTRGRRVMLETNGTLPAAMARVAGQVAIVSMDVKLDSVDGQGVPLETHRSFLHEAVRAGCEVFVKIVVGPGTDEDELAAAVAMVHGEAPRSEVYLQPVTPFGAVRATPRPDQVLAWQELALALHPHVRVVPQTHKLIGQL